MEFENKVSGTRFSERKEEKKKGDECKRRTRYVLFFSLFLFKINFVRHIPLGKFPYAVMLFFQAFEPTRNTMINNSFRVLRTRVSRGSTLKGVHNTQFCIIHFGGGVGNSSLLRQISISLYTHKTHQSEYIRSNTRAFLPLLIANFFICIFSAKR